LQSLRQTQRVPSKAVVPTSEGRPDYPETLERVRKGTRTRTPFCGVSGAGSPTATWRRHASKEGAGAPSACNGWQIRLDVAKFT